jgi:dihydrolipoamide dehydrogenase
MRTIDTITLGAGGGAYPAAFALARAGRQVIMVDSKGVMSGNCLAEGCVPSKAVREVAELHRRATAAPSLRLEGNQHVDYAQILSHKEAVQRTRYSQHDAELAALGGRVELIAGHARLLDCNTVEVTAKDGVEQIRAEHVIIATGADISVPAIPGAELCVTSRDLFALRPTVTTLPHRLVVIGGGYVGLEAACMLSSLGTEVTVLEALSQLLPGMDPAFVALVAGGLDPRIAVMLGASVTAIERGNGHGLRVNYTRSNQQSSVQADLVLMATGRRCVVPEGAERIGLTLEGHGLSVTPTLQTSLSHVYAPGDVNGRQMLFHSAVRQSLVAAHNILAGDSGVDRMDFDSVPTAIFTHPEAAYVGLTRAAACARGVPVIEGSYALEGDSRAQILGEPYGEVRLFFQAESPRLLGGWVVGVDSAQLIGEIGLAVAHGLHAYDIARFADQHPMVAEGISGAARHAIA